MTDHSRFIVDVSDLEVTRKDPAMNDQTTLVLERRDQPDLTGEYTAGEEGPVVMFTPPIDDDYWAYRVVVGDGQAIVGFPKFSTVGVGFSVEDDWNTNLPYTCDTNSIWVHICGNKGDDDIPDERCIEAIRMIQQAVTEDRGLRAPSVAPHATLT